MRLRLSRPSAPSMMPASPVCFRCRSKRWLRPMPTVERLRRRSPMRRRGLTGCSAVMTLRGRRRDTQRVVAPRPKLLPSPPPPCMNVMRSTVRMIRSHPRGKRRRIAPMRPAIQPAGAEKRPTRSMRHLPLPRICVASWTGPKLSARYAHTAHEDAKSERAWYSYDDAIRRRRRPLPDWIWPRFRAMNWRHG